MFLNLEDLNLCIEVIFQTILFDCNLLIFICFFFYYYFSWFLSFYKKNFSLWYKKSAILIFVFFPNLYWFFISIIDFNNMNTNFLSISLAQLKIQLMLYLYAMEWYFLLSSIFFFFWFLKNNNVFPFDLFYWFDLRTINFFYLLLILIYYWIVQYCCLTFNYFKVIYIHIFFLDPNTDFLINYYYNDYILLYESFLFF